jgi:hypothetical protein
LYVSESWSLSLREEKRSRAFGNKVLREICTYEAEEKAKKEIKKFTE